MMGKIQSPEKASKNMGRLILLDWNLKNITLCKKCLRGEYPQNNSNNSYICPQGKKNVAACANMKKKKPK